MNDFICELCGNPTNKKIFRIVEGVKMLVCRDCIHLGDEPPSRKPLLTKNYSTQYKQYREKTPSTTSYSERSKSGGYVNRIQTPRAGYVKRAPKVENLELKKDYRKALRKLRQNNNLSQSEFAQKIGITHASYKSIEGGKTDLLIKDAIKIEKKYKVSLTGVIAEDDFDDSLLMKGSGSGYTLADAAFKRKKGKDIFDEE